MNGKLWWAVLATFVVLNGGALGLIVSRQFTGIERLVIIEEELKDIDSDLDKEVAGLVIELNSIRADMDRLEDDVGWIYKSNFADVRE